jgi:anti-sigma-K factor RskA
MTPDPRRARLEELLGIEATQGLTPAEATELDRLLEAFPDEDPDGFELAAAAVHLALAGAPGEMPPALAEKLHLAAVALTPASSLRSRPAARAGRSGRRTWAMWAGWAVAAGLAGVLVYTNWPQPDVAARRTKLERDPTAAAKSFAGEKAGASAAVVWSNAKQEGYLEVRGLPPNDPKKEQYQLWIVDGGRVKKQPVDGGVFDVRPDGTALVPVRNPIQVKDAQAFAITKEVAGGVVESEGPMLVVLTPKSG